MGCYRLCTVVNPFQLPVTMVPHATREEIEIETVKGRCSVLSHPEQFIPCRQQHALLLQVDKLSPRTHGLTHNHDTRVLPGELHQADAKPNPNSVVRAIG